MYQQLIADKKSDFEKAIDHFHTELGTVRTGRASPVLVENILVDSYGTKTPLKNLASITVPEARSLAIQPWDKSIMQSVEKAIAAANIGIQPINDGQYIRLNMPMLTEERRKELVKLIKQMAESARVRVRNIREEVWKEVGKLVKDKEITEDNKFAAEKELKKIIDEYNDKIKVLLEKKEAEVMKV